MGWMDEAETELQKDLGDDPTENEIEQWYGDYYREHLRPFLPSSRIGYENDTQ